MKPPISSEPVVNEKKRIVLIEDHPVTRAGLAALLDQHDMDVCGQSDSVVGGLELIEKLKPDLVIADISLKAASGIELVKKLKVTMPDLPVLIMSMHDESLYAERALKAGARGYIMKQEASENILEGVRRVLKKELYLSQKMREKLLHGLARQKHGENVPFAMDTLSDREMEVFLLIGQGHGTKNIAALLSISTKTVDTYREHLKVKLRLPGSAELVHHAVQWVKSENIVG